MATCLSLVQNKAQFYVLRVLLGIAEGGVFPGAWYFLSLFFPPDALTFPNSTIDASVAISSILASPAAILCLAIGSSLDVEGWRVLFIVEGLLPILYGVFVFFNLIPHPEQESFLTHEQKQWLLSQQPHEEEK